MNESHQHDSEGNLEAPPKLVEALKKASDQKIFVPRTVDQAVSRAAKEHFAMRANNRSGIVRRWMLWPAFAAAAALVIVTCLFKFQRESRSRAYAREDLNQDGKVDILDAFALARQLQSTTPPTPTMDVNGDGVIDQRDVALIAAHAVELKKDKGS